MANYKLIKQDIVKTISYRVFGTLTSIAIGYFVSGSYEVGLSVGLGDVLIKPIVYFIHERIWRKVK
jgi:uncharacterized membrane protein